MKAIHSFTVRPQMPEGLAALEALAMNLRWSWDEQTRDLFRWVDPDGWDATVHDPMRLLAVVSKDRLRTLQADAGFMRFLSEVHGKLLRYLDAPRWFQAKPDSPLRSVAYFSPEFGIAEAVPQYSGGLGVLAGDTLKAGSDLGVPMTGVGLFYRHGYFRQALTDDGWQREIFPELDPDAMALQPCDGVEVHVALAHEELTAHVWKAQVGRVGLYLLDADVEANSEDLRNVTDRLYGGDVEHRLRQEILLGIGGVRMLEAIGQDPQVFHTNEGHAGFLGLERIRRFIVDDGLSFDEAIEAVKAGNIFTTHTPVPAGIDQFPRELMGRYFSAWVDECGISLDQLMAIGHRPADAADAPFNMAVMGMRLAARRNAVAKLHGAVSRKMFSELWPDVPADEVPIGSITNGVHATTWVTPEMDDLLVRHALPEWQEAGADRWARVDEAGDDELWQVLRRGRERLVGIVRARMCDAAVARGAMGDLDWCERVLDSDVLTVGFARRFATYKRATLLLSQEERLLSLLASTDRPVQFVFAGKAHPADEQGKKMIQQVVQFSRRPEVRHRFVYVEDYDIAIARAMYGGVDVWLNTPRRPQEACGTSGMKSALNGGLNCSILDGWWDEMYDGDNGWAIASAEHVEDLARRDEVEANSLFELLEGQIVPLYYDGRDGAVPRPWVRKVKASLRSLGPQVSAARMVRDYVDDLYEPTARHTDRLLADRSASARALAAWKRRVLELWDGVRVTGVDAGKDRVTELGGHRDVEATVDLGGLDVGDVQVQLLHGPVGGQDELDQQHLVVMRSVDASHPGASRWTAAFECVSAGRYGFTVRVVPNHDDLPAFTELGRITLT
jgi:glycogen phosphorylase